MSDDSILLSQKGLSDLKFKPEYIALHCHQTVPYPMTNIEVINDLRPISILPALSKVFERYIGSQLRVFANENNILPPYQSGFKAGYSSTSALAHIADDVIHAASALVLLEFSKAFDTIHHKSLPESIV
ncbi:hypothetical protein Trydic_g21180 [Trypoxylus dichotomus]